MPKVSIITPLFNGSKTLLESAGSVNEQIYEDWEWILFDDGSTDGTQDIAQKISERNPERIFYFEHSKNSNHGTAYTRNRAVELSNGEIISFIDQDDIWYPNRLSHHINLFDIMTDTAMIWGPALYWYKERSFKQPVGYRGKGLTSGEYDSPEFVRIFLSDLRGTPLPSASLVKKKYFVEVKGFEESIRGSEDIVLWLKLANKYKIYYEDEILIKYRKHQDSTLRIASQSGIMNEWNLIFNKWVIDFLKENSFKKDLIEEYEFAYYSCLKKLTADESYLKSRRDLLKKLNLYPDIKKKYFKDYLLDLILPFNIATKVSAKLRFNLFKTGKIKD